MLSIQKDILTHLELSQIYVTAPCTPKIIIKKIFTFFLSYKKEQMPPAIDKETENDKLIQHSIKSLSVKLKKNLLIKMVFQFAGQQTLRN